MDINNIKRIFPGILILCCCISCSLPRLLHRSDNQDKALLTANAVFERTGYQDIYLSDSLIFNMETDLKGLAVSSPLLYSNTLINITHNGYLYFLNSEDIGQLEKTRIADGIGTSPTLYGNIMYIASNLGDYGLTVYDATAGEILKQIKGKLSQSSPLVTNGRVVHATLNGEIIAYDRTTFDKIWYVQLDDAILNNLALHNNNLVVAAQNGTIKSYNIDNGSLNWSLKINSAFYASPVISGNAVYLCGYNGDITKINIKSGILEKVYTTDIPVYYTPSIDTQTLYVPLSNGTILALDRDQLRLNWSTALEGPFSASLLITANKVIAGSASRKLFVLNKNVGSVVQKIELEGRPRTQPVFFKDRLYVSYEPYYYSVFTVHKGAEDE